MSSDQKIPFSQSVNLFTDRKINDALQSYSQSYPCYVTAVNGSIVTVKFDVTVPNGVTLPEVTCPIAGAEYIRYPIQEGCKGYCIPANVSLRNASGLGAGGAPPDLSDPGNLTALVFFPFGNTQFFEVNGQYLVMYGEEGVQITTKHQDCSLTLTSTGIIINLNGGNLIINNGSTAINGSLTVNGDIASTGAISNNGKNIGSTHEHSGVTTGGSNTGQPI